MKKVYSILLSGLMLSSSAAYAWDSANNGTAYTLTSLSAIEGSGVTKTGDKEFLISGDITIKPGDSFTLEAGVVVKMSGSTQLRSEGPTNLGGEARTTITRASETDTPKGFYIVYDGDKHGIVKNLDFEYASLRNYGEQGLDIDNCTFRNSNGKLSSAGALTLGKSGATFKITNCTFENNTVPGIGSGANLYCGVLVEKCTFIDNNQANTNKPQLNISVGQELEVIVKDCTFKGNKRTKVGGISINNMMSGKGSNKVLIENCDIRDHRYGINSIGPMSVTVRGCKLIDNKYEENPMNGGSGISFTSVTTAIISGCHIENCLWGVTLIKTQGNLGEIGNNDSPGNNVFVNNGNESSGSWVPYDLYNNSTYTVYAQNNTWSVPEQTAAEIEKVIFHKADDETLGEVIYMPAHGNAGIDDVTAGDNATAEYFNLQGIRVAEPKAGQIYLRRQGSKTSKVLVK